ncbi:ArsR family transcriptional regulator [Gilliamella sp. Pra-s65]|uniref:sugar-binding transcriptional regulator n=1 Tax=unclassified Gilliamella TaxID=2685620 RepID=UPI0013663124|nr:MULTISPECIES: sugar-binding transcriptional regulator [unclassified Gilliamella]MWN90505.1 ArsR family transcriptional regulator [Gilliamella sp. Pra-s65]MWP73520.1 ArsR family transcriptional regulator [Gilliamella sp. Pra-s52]
MINNNVGNYDFEQHKLLIKIAQLYYEENKTQSEIAKIVNIHRSSISRMLKVIRELGIVSISINYDLLPNIVLEEKIVNKFNLKQVIVVPINQNINNDSKNQIVCNVAANVLIKNIHDNDVIGISWGRTVNYIVSNLKSDNTKLNNVTVVPMIGGPSGKIETKYHVNNIAYNLSNKLNSQAILIDYPAIVDTEQLKIEIEKTQHMKELEAWWSNITVALFSIGCPAISKSSIWYGFYGELFQTIANKKIVGDILSHFFDNQGTELKTPFCNQIIGVTLDNLKKIPLKICASGDSEKINSLKAALNANYIDILVISDEIASQLID